MGNISRIVLCSKVTNSLQFIDPTTLKTADLSASIFWRDAFPSLSDATQLVEFVVLDVEPTGETRGKYVSADVTVARSADLGLNDTTFYVRSHLGAILHPGDSVLGYYTVNANYNSDLWDSLDSSQLPDVVLVKKHYTRKSKKSKQRLWKLKRMAREHNDIVAHDETSRAARQEAERAERDYELFLQELEEDPELRQVINIYKAGEDQPKVEESDMEEDDDDEDAPQIELDELLDDLDDLTLADQEMS